MTEASTNDEVDLENDQTRVSKSRSGWRGASEWIVIVGGALLAALLVKTFLFQAFYIPSPSMTPTLAVGDRVLVNKVSYKVGEIERGDVVVFARPASEGTGGIKDLIKRVVALPGETIESRNGKVFVDDRLIGETYLTEQGSTENLQRQEVPAGMVFVMGDNRANSKDSRVFGPIPIDSVVGRAYVRVWPLNHLGLL